MKQIEHFLMTKEENSQAFSRYSTHNQAIEYKGCEYKYMEYFYIQRTAKITPKKVGQFVTLWKRSELGVTEPYDFGDPFDFVVIICCCAQRMGRFVFPKSILLEKGIISNKASKVEIGKRGFRIYPPWSKPTSKQAINSQGWQNLYYKEGLILNEK